MSLAEPRSRQKWSDDPRNTRWASDKSKFGYQMLTKMGWSEGKGLGQKESGGVSHIKVCKRKNNAGIGVKSSHDDDWIAQQDDFNALLSRLNQGSSTASTKKISSLEERVKLSRKKILYTKFVKSKDLSNASSQDLACIFGQRSKSLPSTPKRSDGEESDSNDSTASCPVTANVNEHGITTVNSGISVADYFAKKMAALKQARTSSSANIQDEEVTKESEKKVEEDVSEKNVTFLVGNKEICRKKKKKKKGKLDVESENKERKKQKSMDTEEKTKEEECVAGQNINELQQTKKKNKKKRKTEEEERSIENENLNDGHMLDICKKKKKKKRQHKEVDILEKENDHK